MRIISEFKDYYDCCQAYGQDQTLLYRRLPKKVEGEKALPTLNDISNLYRRYGGSPMAETLWAYREVLVGFCGRVYPVLETTTSELLWANTKEARAARAFHFSADDLDKWVTRTFGDREEVYFSQQIKSYDWSYFNRRRFVTYFDRFVQAQDQYAGLFDAARSPIFVALPAERSIGRYKYSTNPSVTYDACLKDFEFYRVKDAPTAYQEVAMWLGNQADPGKTIPEIDDVTMAEAKGFDKWSFRKQSSKKR